MESRAREYLSYLKDHASQLKKDAREWGFTEEQIKECIEEALKEGECMTNSPRNIARKCWHYFRVLVKLLAVIICIVAVISLGVGLMVTYHKPTSDVVDRAIQPYGYAIFRAVRLLTLPVHNFLNITGA